MSRVRRVYIPLRRMPDAPIPCGTAAYCDPWDVLTLAEDEGYPLIFSYMTSPLEAGRTTKPLDHSRPSHIYLTRRTTATGDKLIDTRPDEPKIL